MLFAVLWLAFLWASTRPDAAQGALLLDWGALTGGTGPLDRPACAADRGPRAAPGHRAVPACRLGAPARQPGVPADLRPAGGAGDGAVALPVAVPARRRGRQPRRGAGDRRRRDRLIIGASGAVSAVIGAYLALFPRAQAGRGAAAGAVPGVRARAGVAADRDLGAAAGRVRLYRPGVRRGGVGRRMSPASLFGVVFALVARAGIARRLRRRSGY